MDEIDLHAIVTPASIEVTKKVLATDVFGNYDVADEKPGKYELGVFLFRYNPKVLILKLDYTFHNYRAVSKALMDSFGSKLMVDRYFIVGLKVYDVNAFVRVYGYDPIYKSMSLKEEIEHADGIQLTPAVKDKYGIDTHDMWKVAQEKYNTEVMRQNIKGKSAHNITGQFVGCMKQKWEKQFGNLDNIDTPICDSMFFVAHKEIEKYRKKSSEVEVDFKKLGKISSKKNIIAG